MQRMGNLESKTTRDYLAGFNPHRATSKPVIRDLPEIAHNVNGGSAFAREIRNTFTTAVHRALADLKSKGSQPADSDEEEQQGKTSN
jgi:hypothetical protein